MTRLDAVVRHKLYTLLVMLLTGVLLLSACEPAAVQVIPTALPTETATFTPSPTRTPGINASPTLRRTRVAEATGGPSPTPLFGATRTPLPDDAPTPTRSFNPNAARIEFFTSDPLSVEPGGQVSLFWSARNVDSAVIYRLDSEGNRSQVYNVAPDGNLPIQTRSSDRGALNFVLAVGEGADYSENRLTIPLECPVEWFFSPAPDDCPQDAATETTIIDQTMERGRMLYIQEDETIYTLFNDGQQPAWSTFENRYDPEQHASRDPNAPPEWIQPLNELGFVWRGDNTVRSRLGLGTAEAIEFQGFVQVAPASGGREMLYISGANGVVLQVLPGNERWQIIGGPR
jgi:hypothetical protein